MSYEQSASCKLVATHCACCCRPLVDAISVEAGVGPVCREKHGYNAGPAENRTRANKLVYLIAAKQSGDEVAEWVVELRALGFTRLADIIIARLDNVIQITREGADYLVRTPYRPELFAAWHAVSGQHWDHARKLRVVPERSYTALWTLIDRCFSRMKVVGEPRPAPPPAQPSPQPSTQSSPPPAASRTGALEIRIEQTATEYLVHPPYRADLVRLWPQQVPGAIWDSARFARRVPLSSRAALWSFLRRHFVGAVVVTATSRTTIVAEDTAPSTSTPTN